ncbi:MAG: PepSY domain-containing protein [Actinomycetes bacterium]
MDGTSEWRGWRSWGGKAALAVGGMLVGGILVGTLTASANNGGTAAQNGAYGAPSWNGGYGGPAGPRHGGNVDESKSQRPDEHLLTGDTATKVRAAALARYPGATVLRVETDSDGVYEAHLTTTDGRRVTVEVDKAFKVTGEEAGPGRP